MSMKLSHWSPRVVPKVRGRRQLKSDMGGFSKPEGFWVSVDGPCDWLEWTTSEDFGRGAIRHRVELVRDAKVLFITNVVELDAFAKKYEKLYRFGTFTDQGIDWKAVAKDYHGIIIAPYQWERRLSRYSKWYYGWDCASGCIWNPKAIQSIDAIEDGVILNENKGDH